MSTRAKIRKWTFITLHPIRAHRFHRAATAPWPPLPTVPECNAGFTLTVAN